MKLLHPVIFCLPVLLLACTPLPHRAIPATNQTNTIQYNQQLASDPASAVPAAKPVPAVEQVAEPVSLPNLSLDERTVFEFLLADMAAQRGHLDLAAQTYAELAQSTRDPRVAKRAAQLAMEAHQMERAVQALKLWQELEPSALQAKQMLASLLLAGGKWDEAREQVANWLAADAKNSGQIFIALQSLLVRSHDKSVALAWLQAMIRPYPELAEAHWAVGVLALVANQRALALTEAQTARKCRSDFDKALILEVKIRLSNESEQALALLQQYLTTYPKNKEIRLFYARTLLEQKDYVGARKQFQQFLTDYPDSNEIAYAIALLSLQLGELERAEQELQNALALGAKDTDTLHYYLGQLNEEKKNNGAALEHYRQVEDGEHVFAARLRQAYLLNQAGKLEEARAILKAAPAVSNQQRVTAVIAEGQMLRDANNNAEYYQVVSDAVDKLPNHPQLLFELAMAADKLGKIEVFEKTLRKVIQIDPENAHAYNALGYSFLERNVQLEEGVQLVEKAYQLAPDSPAIADSLGWGYYRTGKFDQSLTLLNQAFAADPDPEIAAHLGEVLWVRGATAEAKKVWEQALKAHPDSHALQAVMKKFIH